MADTETPKSDIEIARAADIKPIEDIAGRLQTARPRQYSEQPSRKRKWSSGLWDASPRRA